eukprot:1160193-Pelagomonas_calceolata.AAC.7
MEIHETSYSVALGNTERDWMTDPQQAPPYPVPARPQQMQQAAGDGQEQPKSLFSGLESLRNFDPEVLEARLKKEEEPCDLQIKGTWAGGERKKEKKRKTT